MSKSKLSKKKLLILIWNLGIGGVQKRIKDISIDISNNYPEYHIYILSMSDSPRCFNHQLENLKNVSIIYYPYNNYHKYKRRFRFNSPFGWIIKQYIKIHPDVCLTFLSHFSCLITLLNSLMFWRKTRIILNEVAYTSKYLSIHTNYPNLEKFLIRQIYPLADCIICPTKIGAQDLISNFRIPKNKITIIRNWTLFPTYNPSTPKWDLIYIGRFAKEKNLLDLINVIYQLKPKLPKIKLLLLGEGDLKNKIKELILKLSLTNNIDVLPTNNNVAKYLKKSKIFISLSQNEGLPNVVLEAAMCQLPSIINNFEGAEEVVTHKKTGFITNNQSEIISSIFKLVDNNQLRSNMGKNAQHHVIKSFGMPNQKIYIQKLLQTN